MWYYFSIFHDHKRKVFNIEKKIYIYIYILFTHLYIYAIHTSIHPFAKIQCTLHQEQQCWACWWSKNGTILLWQQDCMHGKHPTNSWCPVAAHNARRAAYQASVWATSNTAQQRRPIPEFCGWTWDECNKKWVPVWITLTIANEACQKLVKCGSKCERPWHHARCTELCKCSCLR